MSPALLDKLGITLFGKCDRDGPWHGLMTRCGACVYRLPQTLWPLGGEKQGGGTIMASTRFNIWGGEMGQWGCTSLQLPPVIMAQFKLRMQEGGGGGGNCTPWWPLKVQARGRPPRFVFKYSIVLFYPPSVS